MARKKKGKKGMCLTLGALALVLGGCTAAQRERAVDASEKARAALDQKDRVCELVEAALQALPEDNKLQKAKGKCADVGAGVDQVLEALAPEAE